MEALMLVEIMVLKKQLHVANLRLSACDPDGESLSMIYDDNGNEVDFR
jgi:hypothetical protein